MTGRYDIQQDDTWHNNTKPNGTGHYSYAQHNNTQHNDKKCNKEHKYTQHNDQASLS
jgi:hypothetical protein